MDAILCSTTALHLRMYHSCLFVKEYDVDPGFPIFKIASAQHILLLSKRWIILSNLGRNHYAIFSSTSHAYWSMDHCSHHSRAGLCCNHALLCCKLTARWDARSAWGYDGYCYLGDGQYDWIGDIVNPVELDG